MIVRCDDFAIDYQVPPSTFIAKMTDRQKAAIASIYIDDCGFNGMFRQISNYWESFLTNDADLEYEDHVPFAKLTGLRRIESRVWKWASRSHELAPAEEMVDAVRLAMGQVGVREEMRIEVKIKHGRDCEKVVWYYATI
jgi:hypothetical protein